VAILATCGDRRKPTPSWFFASPRMTEVYGPWPSSRVTFVSRAEPGHSPEGLRSVGDSHTCRDCRDQRLDLADAKRHGLVGRLPGRTAGGDQPRRTIGRSETCNNEGRGTVGGPSARNRRARLCRLKGRTRIAQAVRGQFRLTATMALYSPQQRGLHQWQMTAET
jgi:hypothetical protein